MAHFLTNKRILVGITGSIAAYKSADLVRRLREAGAIVRVAMTENAQRFITPLTLQALSGFPVHTDLFDLQAEAAMGHIELARWADLILIAPATAGFMERLKNGSANDLLTTLCLASKAPIALAPAMNQGMWQHTLTQQNLQALIDQGCHFLGTEEGSQACGDVGPGRMLEPAVIIEKVQGIFSTGTLAGISVLVTAGPTHEVLDPIRYITNASSGKMGYALAQAALEAGAKVTLVTGPVALKPPAGITCIPAVSALDMHAAVMENIAACDIFLAVAAVSDYRSQRPATQKMHKTESVSQLTLERNPDIVESVNRLQPRPFIVGFAAETENIIANAQIKRARKGMDIIIANQVGDKLGMGTDENTVTLITANEQIPLPPSTKDQLARQLITIIANYFFNRESYDAKIKFARN